MISVVADSDENPNFNSWESMRSVRATNQLSRIYNPGRLLLVGTLYIVITAGD